MGAAKQALIYSVYPGQPEGGAAWLPDLNLPSDVPSYTAGGGGTHKMSKVFLSFSLKELFVKKKKKLSSLLLSDSSKDITEEVLRSESRHDVTDTAD